MSAFDLKVVNSKDEERNNNGNLEPKKGTSFTFSLDPSFLAAFFIRCVLPNERITIR